MPDRVTGPRKAEPRKLPPARGLMDPGDSPGPLPESEMAFEVAGEDWLARVTGAARSGTGPDGGAPLIVVAFSKADAPDEPLREVLTVGASIDEPGSVVALFRRAEPYRSSGASGRRGKGDGVGSGGRRSSRRPRSRKKKKPGR